MSGGAPRLNRRDLMRLAAGGVGYGTLLRLSEGTAFAAGPIGPVSIENLQPGTIDWLLTKPARAQEIEGYASLTSVNRGGQIQFFVNCADSQYKLEIFRLGWYGGLGGRRMLGPITRTGIRQPAPSLQPATNLIECAWNSPYTLTVPYDAGDPTVWASGMYVAKLTGLTNGWQTYIPFVVRDDQRAADFLFQSSVTTFQAYNTWGGKCLYDYLSPGGRSRKVSFNRPYRVQSLASLAGGCGAAELITGGDGGPPAGWELNMLRWLEREGFDVAYCTNIDVHENPTLLRPYKGFLSVGHDEYWSWEMRQNVTAARDAGVSLGFFSANSVYWQIRLEPSTVNGAPNRTIVCYKYSPRDYQGDTTEDPYYLDSDPSNDHKITITWRGTLPGANKTAMPEEQLIGTQYDFGSDAVNADLVVSNAAHWVFAGTGLVNGAKVRGLVGYEADRMHGSSPVGTVLLARSPHTGNTFTGSSVSDMTLYQAASKALVFATGSMQWAFGLDDFNAGLRGSVASEAAQQITRNVLTAFTNAETHARAAAHPGGPYSSLMGEAVQFDGSASKGFNSSSIVRYEWDFGDGTSGVGVSPTHVYAQPGSYIVRLSVTDAAGTVDSSLASVTVYRLIKSVTADSTWDTVWQGKRYYYPPEGLADDILPAPTDADIFKQWVSAGGLTMSSDGYLATPVNVYCQLYRRSRISSIRLYQSAYNQGSQLRTREYKLYSRITGGAWTLIGSGSLADVHLAAGDTAFTARDADEIRIQIMRGWDLVNKAVGLAEVRIGTDGPVGAGPVVKIGGPYSGTVSQPIQFDGRASYDPDGTIVKYEWSFGDGTTSTAANPSKIYNTAGSYTVRLTVTDNNGLTASETATVPVATQSTNKPPVAQTTGPYVAAVGKPVPFDGGLSSDPDGTIASYAWAFGDGTTGAGVRPVKSYAQAGTYSVNLTVTDNSGGKASVTTTAVAGPRYKTAVATSVYDSNRGGTRFYYPATGVGDYVVPVPTSSDLTRQWLSSDKLRMDSTGKLSTPVSLTLTLWFRKTVRQIKLNQASFTDGKSFHTKDFVVYARPTGGSWVRIGSGQMPNTKAALVTLNVTAAEADEIGIEVISTWDTSTSKGVGLSEVEVL